ncbi:MAG: hypothetical protein ACKOA8_19285 [Deltaproteobacteria bacterium]|jgi:hypothetical protein
MNRKFNIYRMVLLSLMASCYLWADITPQDKFRLTVYGWVSAIMEENRTSIPNFANDTEKNWVIGCLADTFIQKGLQAGCPISDDPRLFMMCQIQHYVIPAENQKTALENLKLEVSEVSAHCVQQRSSFSH